MGEDGGELTRPIEGPWTGGCQCGAVRFSVPRLLEPGHLCHCRMCQRATGALFAALVPVVRDEFSWSREPEGFRSSTGVTRHFCAACGTSLSYDWGGEDLSLSVAAFDDSSRIPIGWQSDTYARHPALTGLALEETHTEDIGANPDSRQVAPGT